MAGVNLSEESARILATNSALVGTVTRSCKDEAFLATSLLTRRALEIGKTHTSNRLKKKKGRRRPTPRLNLFVSSPPSSSSSRQGKKFGVGELGADVINFISHAAQQRLQSLLEKVSQVALQKNTTFKVTSDSSF